MANPQKENGYVAIANEIWDAMTRIRLRTSERQVLDTVIRKTYGWNKKSDNISLSQLQEMTGLSKRTVIYAIQNLEAKNMLVVQRLSDSGLKSPSNITFQKDYSAWVVQRNSTNYSQLLETQRLKYKSGGAKKALSGAKNDDLVVQRTENKVRILAHTKDTLTKDSNKSHTETEKVALYHKHCPSLPKVLKLTEQRIKHINARISEFPDLDWSVYFKRVEGSDFLTNRSGANRNGWSADFDFVINKSSIVKILEGKYDNKTGSVQRVQPRFVGE